MSASSSPDRAPGRVQVRQRLDRPPAHRARHGRLEAELVKIARISLIIVDELGYVPFEAEAANLSFQLVSTRYGKASLIITSNLPNAGSGRSSATPRSPRP